MGRKRAVSALWLQTSQLPTALAAASVLPGQPAAACTCSPVLQTWRLGAGACAGCTTWRCPWPTCWGRSSAARTYTACSATPRTGSQQTRRVRPAERVQHGVVPSPCGTAWAMRVLSSCSAYVAGCRQRGTGTARITCAAASPVRRLRTCRWHAGCLAPCVRGRMRRPEPQGVQGASNAPH